MQSTSRVLRRYVYSAASISLCAVHYSALLADVCSPLKSAVGSATGSHAWTSSGEQAKAHGMATMKAAGENRDPATQGYGKAEELAGKAVGCEGMRKEGEQSQ
jgi:uncharacterized protein YjbJ (UPF0337 family)